MINFTYRVGIDLLWYAVFDNSYECAEAWDAGFGGFAISCFDGYENAIRISE